MNASQLGLLAALLAAGAGAVVAVLLPSPARGWVTGVATAGCGAAGVVSGLAAFGEPGWSVALPDLLPLSGVRIGVDQLGGCFMAVVGGVAVATGIYAMGYLQHVGAGGHRADSRVSCAVLPLFVMSMLLVPASADVATFLLCWELMAVTSLVLVVTEHRRRPEVASAGRWYAVMTHLGFVAVMAGLLLLVAGAPDPSFEALRVWAADLPTGTVALVLIATLIGFGAKAGVVPLHAWLPRAHAESPSHVSALMSAAMVALGIYGLLRVGFDVLTTVPTWWWLLVIALGAGSAVYGIVQAAISADLKRLLGNSTTENMGLVLIGLGAAGLFGSAGQTVPAGLALTAALLHVVNHAAFKTLLFLAAGAVVSATGTRDLDALGGLRPRMPAATAGFGWGALAASALPPGTAFVSEWLLLQALIHGVGEPGGFGVVVIPVAVAAVALTAGLSVATYVKAFGVGFLARPRSDAAADAHDGPIAMTVGMVLAGVTCLVLALVPGLLLPALGGMAATLIAGDPADTPVRGLITMELQGISGALSPLLLALALLVLTLVTFGAVRATAARRAVRREVRLWDCGAGPPTSRMEYTATSFAEPLQRVFDDVVAPERDVDVSHHEESAYLVQAVEYRQSVPDRVERLAYRPVLGFLRAWGRRATWLANGSIHRYLGYGFVTLCALFVVLVVTR